MGRNEALQKQSHHLENGNRNIIARGRRELGEIAQALPGLL
jgi:hypothetical protein